VSPKTPTSRATLRAGLVAVGLWAAASAAYPATGAAQEMLGPSAVIEEIIERALAVLNDPSLDKPQRISALEEIALDRFDFRTMSKLVLARNWKRFTPEQQEEFQAEFKNYLSSSYGNRLDRFNNERIRVTGEREEPRGDVTVLSVVVGGEFDNASVNYRLRNRSGRWLVIDVMVEGISFVSNYRDQFREVLGNGGPEHLLERLREKNLPETETEAG
jgi:phospholipid transport system substrate-binding protein